MENWYFLTIIYAIFVGLFQCTQKKAAEKSSIYEVLAGFSLIAFVLTAFTSKDVFQIEFISFALILLKSLVIIISWLLAMYALSKMPISLYSVISLSKIIFSIILSIIFLGEKLTSKIIIGMIIVIIGLILVNQNSNKKESKETSLKVFVLLLISCLLSSISSIIDKKVLESVTSSQLQFWFLALLTIGYWLIILIRNEKINFKKMKNNYWILITAICLALGDRILFIVNKIPESQVSLIIIIKQLSVIENIIIGKLLFKEKNIIKKLLYSILIIFGVIVVLI